MATKPNKLPRWATAPDAGDVIEPSESGATGSKDKGFKAGYKPPAQWINWLLYYVYLWCAYLDDLANQAFTWTEAHVFQKGVTVTNSTANGNGFTCTGNGTGNGGTFTGGGTNGTGIVCTGGAGNGKGIVATGTGTEAGGTFTGGGSGGAGIVCTGGAGNGKGIVATGNGNGSAVYATTGSGGGYAIQALPAIGSGGQGLFASSDGAGVAVTAISGANGAAIFAQAGGGNKPGIRSSGNGTGAAVQCESGGVKFDGTEPAAGADPGANTAWAASQAKAWVNIITDGSNGITKPGDYAVSSVTIVTSRIRIDFAHDFGDTNYTVSGMGLDGVGRFYVVEDGGLFTDRCFIRVKDKDDVLLDPAAVPMKFMLQFFGRH